MLNDSPQYGHTQEGVGVGLREVISEEADLKRILSREKRELTAI